MTSKPRVHGLIDLTHSTRTEQLNNLVVSDAGAGYERHDVDGVNSGKAMIYRSGRQNP